MIITANTRMFEKQMRNVVDYSIGFLDGVKSGKPLFLDNLGSGIVFALGQYIDVMASANPKALHHIYEWNNVGSPSARLFDVDYRVTGMGLTLGSKFKQSRTVSSDMTQPFYNKAKIMEQGTPVKIIPTGNNPLKFNSSTGQVFTKSPVLVNNPGGDEVAGSFERTVQEFLSKYLTQSFLRSSGLYEYIEKPVLYKKNIRSGSKLGRSKGIETGFSWITHATIGVE
jgi:hypothetical protein